MPAMTPVAEPAAIGGAGDITGDNGDVTGEAGDATGVAGDTASWSLALRLSSSL